MMAFSDHSFPVAMILTADRVLRCGGDLEQYPEIVTGVHRGRRLDYPSSRVVPAKLSVEQPHDVAAETIVPTDSVTKAIQFTNRLINQHCYSSALLEIERLLYYDASLQREPALYLNQLKCFEGLQQYSDGLLLYEQRMPSEVKTNYKIKYTTAHLYDLVGDHAKSLSLFQEASRIWDSNDTHPYGELALLYAKESLYDEAKSALEHKYSLDSNLSAFATSCSILDRLASAPRKNPTTAMLLGIMPGAGYLYVGQPQNALSSFLVNGLLAYALYTTIKAQNYGLGIVVGVFSISFYGGNITGAGSSAKRFNEKIERDAMNELRKNNPFFY